MLIPAVEVLLVTRSVQEAIRDPSKTEGLGALMEKAHDDVKMQTFDQHLLQLYQSGVINAETAKRAATHRTDGERALNDVRSDPHVQYLPRALLLHARAEATEGSRTRGAALGREAFAWLRESDLSPPAYARLAERIADVAARTGDVATIASVRRFIVAKDAGRNLRSYTLALMTIDACAAFARGDMRTAFSLAQRTSGPMFYGRATSITLQLEADALAALGERTRADSLYRVIVDPSAPILDGDGETFEIVRRAAANALRRA